jgi:hypothetical protein
MVPPAVAREKNPLPNRFFASSMHSQTRSLASIAAGVCGRAWPLAESLPAESRHAATPRARRRIAKAHQRHKLAYSRSLSRAVQPHQQRIRFGALM